MRVGIDCRKIRDYGIGTYIRGLLGGLSELDVELVAFAPRDARDLLPSSVDHVIVDAPHYSLRELIAIGRAADRATIEVFHAPHYVVPITRRPVVVTIHDLIHLHQPLRNPLAPLYARVMLRRAVGKSVRVLTVSDAVKNQLVDELGCAPSKVAVTPNGVDERFFAPGPAATEYGRYFFFAGNDKPHKNVRALVEAFGLLRREHSDLRLVLAGGDFERLRAPQIDVVGFVSDERMAALYRGALAVVVPSHEEGFGLPALEAMSCGAPVITSMAPSLLEITGGAALHVDARSPSLLAEAMRRVAGDESLRASMSADGVERARAFSWKRCAQSTLEAYRTTTTFRSAAM